MRRLLVVLGLALLPLAGATPAWAECPVPEIPGVGCLVPSDSPSPTASPPSSPSPSAEPSPTPTPEPTLTPQPTTAATPADADLAPWPLQPGAPPAVVPEAPQAPVTASQTPTSAPVAVVGSPLTQVVPSSYALVVFGLLGVALLAGFLSGLRPAPTGGTVNTTRTRLWAGLGVLAAAAVIGGIGWYRISGEPLLNRQIPFLASAGIAVVVLAVLGGALIIAEQLRTDQNRIGELEDAVRALTEALAPTIENAPRRAES